MQSAQAGDSEVQRARIERIMRQVQPMRSRESRDPDRHRDSPESGSVLIAVITVSVAAIALTAAMFTVVTKTTQAESDSELNDQCEAITLAALNHSFSEIISEVDSTGGGLGAIGIDQPEIYYDSQGNAVGEYRAVVENVGDNWIIVAVGGTPDLTNPRYTSTTRGVLGAVPEVTLKPLPAAFGLSGPVPTPDWKNTDGTNISISGGPDNPAFAASSAETLTALVETLGDRIHSGDMESDALSGGKTTTYTADDGTEIEVPVVRDTDDFVSAALLNDYRNTLRTGAEGLSAFAARTIEASVGSDAVTWGTAGAPEITFINVDEAGSGVLNGATITGTGILVIQHTVKPDDLNLNWDGDVYIIGYSGDDDDLFYPRGDSDITVNGNFVLLADSDTEASFESKDDAVVTVNGAMMVLAEAASHEAEIETEENSVLNVNGIVSLYGSRIELEARDSSAGYNIQGNLTAGVALDTTRGDEFTFDMNGNVDIAYDEDYVRNGIDALKRMEMNLGLRQNQNLASYAYDLVGGGSGGQTGHGALTGIESSIALNGPSWDYGVDLVALQAQADASNEQVGAPWWLGGAVPDGLGGGGDAGAEGPGDGDERAGEIDDLLAAREREAREEAARKERERIEREIAEFVRKEKERLEKEKKEKERLEKEKKKKDKKKKKRKK